MSFWTIPMIMAATLDRRAPPFVLSGSFDANLDGWVAGGATPTHRTSTTRTPPGAIGSNVNGAVADYTLAAGALIGRSLKVSAYVRQASAGSGTFDIQVKIGSGSFSTIATRSSISTTYLLVEGSLLIDSNEVVTVRMRWTNVGSNTTVADDWRIEGF